MWKKHPKYQVLCTELNPWQLPSNLTIIPNMSVSDIETQTKCMASYGFLSPFLLRLRFSSCEVQQFTFLTSKESGCCWNHHCQSCQNVRIQQRIAGDFPSNLSKWISNIHKLPQMFVEKKNPRSFTQNFQDFMGQDTMWMKTKKAFVGTNIIQCSTQGGGWIEALTRWLQKGGVGEDLGNWEHVYPDRSKQ